METQHVPKDVPEAAHQVFVQVLHHALGVPARQDNPLLGVVLQPLLDLREGVLGGVEEKGLVVRDRGAWVGTSPSTAPLQTGWGVLTHTDRKPGACSQGTQPLLSGSGELRLCSGVCVCVCVYEHAPGGTGAHTCVHMFRACVCTDISVCACVCVCVCVCAQQQRAVLIILCDVCTPGSVGGQQGTFTVRPRPEPPRVIRFCGGGTGGRGQSETLSDLSSSRENGLDTPQLDRHRKGCVRNLV